jgi:dihydrofolate synthase/folylpolyglutamate synthase
MQKLCALYDNPQDTFSVIHVAGTNGKGSVCEKIGKALESQGYRTGLYTSPHIESFCERIRLDDAMISEEEVVELYSEIEQKIDSSSTFFEIATLMAFLYFQKQQIHVAVIETGLGGTWDATNVVTPILSVITSIGFDHTEILGSTLEEICQAKAGIIKTDIPVVIGPSVPYTWIRPIATAELYQAPEEGDYELENEATSQLAMNLITRDFPLDEASIKEGLKAKPPCRFERHTLEKQVILDVAHNPQGFVRLIELLQKEYPEHSYRFVCGFSKDKRIKDCSELIQKSASAIHLVSGSHERLASVEEIQKAFTLDSSIFPEKSIAEGIQHALKAPIEKPEVVVITGSFFIMQEAKNFIMNA